MFRLKFSIVLPLLALVVVLVFAMSASAQTSVTGDVALNELSVGRINGLLRVRVQQTGLVSELYKFNQEQVQPSVDKAVAAEQDMKNKQQMLTEGLEEVKKLDERFIELKKKLEEDSGCILEEDKLQLNCTPKDK